jgi:hypothetical protein
MNRFPTTLVLLAAVLLLGGYITLVERRAEQQDRRQERARRALRFDPARVTHLRLTTADLQASLEKEGGVWRLVAPVRTRAHVGEVTRILDTLEALVRSEVITGRQQREQNLNPGDFGFARPRARISLRENGRDMTLLIGRDTPLGGNLFVKVETEASIFVASSNLLASLPARVDDLRDRRIFQGFPNEATRLDIRRPDGLLQLARADQGVWRMQKPYTGRAAYAAVQALLDRLFEARALEFVADTMAAASLYGLDEPAAQITIAGARAKGEQVLRLGRPVEGRTNEVYATLEGTEHVFSVAAGLLETLSVGATDLRDRRLLTLPAYDIGYIHNEEGEQTLSLARAEDGMWSVVEPRQFKANEPRLQQALSEWTGLRIETFIDSPGTNLATWGLSPPDRRIVFARHAPGHGAAATAPTVDPGQTVTLLVARDNDPRQPLVLVKVEGEESLYRVSRDGLAALPMAPLYYRDPVVLRVDSNEVRSVVRTMLGQEQTAERTSATNAFRAAKGAVLDEAAVGRVLAALQQVSADEFVVEDPESLETWGLAQPRATLTLGLSGQGAIGKSIALGDDAGSDAVFALVRGQNVVFTLNHAIRDRLFTPLYLTPPEPAALAEPSATTNRVEAGN